MATLIYLVTCWIAGGVFVYAGVSGVGVLTMITSTALAAVVEARKSGASWGLGLDGF